MTVVPLPLPLSFSLFHSNIHSHRVDTHMLMQTRTYLHTHTHTHTHTHPYIHSHTALSFQIIYVTEMMVFVFETFNGKKIWKQQDFRKSVKKFPKPTETFLRVALKQSGFVLSFEIRIVGSMIGWRS